MWQQSSYTLWSHHNTSSPKNNNQHYPESAFSYLSCPPSRLSHKPLLAKHAGEVRDCPFMGPRNQGELIIAGSSNTHENKWCISGEKRSREGGGKKWRNAKKEDERKTHELSNLKKGYLFSPWSWGKKGKKKMQEGRKEKETEATKSTYPKSRF